MRHARAAPPLLLLLLGLLGACSEGPVGGPEPPSGERSDPGARRSKATQSPVEAWRPPPAADRRARIEKALVEVQAFCDANRDAHQQIIQRWERLRPLVAGTEYQDYVAEQIDSAGARRAAAANRSFEQVRRSARHWAGSDDWDRCFAVLDRFPRRFATTVAGRRMSQLRKQYEAQRQAAVKVSYKYEVDFSRQKIRMSSGVKIEQATQVAHTRYENYFILKFLANQSSRLRLRVEMDKIAGAKLRITHLTAYIAGGDPRSPITVRVNDRILVGDWYPQSENFVTTVWDIEKYLRPGANTIEWQLGDATSHYWLRKFQISDWK